MQATETGQTTGDGGQRVSHGESLSTVRSFIAPALLIICGAASAWLYYWARDLHRFTQWVAAYISLFIGQFAIYLLACYVVFRAPQKQARSVKIIFVVSVIFFAAFFRLELVGQRPYLSTDVYRYVWDGRVQSAGINPYRYVPNADQLRPLRDDRIFPLINRGDYAPTPYPPVAQMIFLVVYKVYPSSAVAFKAAMSLFDMLAMLAVMLVLARMGLDMARAVVFAWHPLLIFESAHTGHVEAPFVAFLALALLAWSYKKPLLAGAFVGLAAMVKFYPAVLLPVFFFNPTNVGGKDAGPVARIWKTLFDRSNLLVIAGFVATVALAYAPYLSVGAGVFGQLMNEFREEGFIESGARYFMLYFARSFASVPTSVFLAAAAIALAAAGVGLMIKKKRDAGDVARSAVALIGLYLFITSPRYHWYYAWILPFLCFAPRLGWLYLTGAAVLLYTLWYIPNVYPEMPLWLGAALYFPTLALLAWEWLRERKEEVYPLGSPSKNADT
jgi:hypothetical protein